MHTAGVILFVGFVVIGLLAVLQGNSIEKTTYVKMTEYEKEEGLS